MNLSDAAELKAFEVDFKWSAAAAILRRVLHDGGTSSTGVPSQQHVHLALQICSQQVWYLPSYPWSVLSHSCTDVRGGCRWTTATI